MSTPDVIERVAAHRPGHDLLEREWGAAARRRCLATIVEPGPADDVDYEVPLRFVPARRPRSWRRVVPVVSGVAVTAALAVVLGAVLLPGSDHRPGIAPGGIGATSGPVFDPPQGLSDTGLAAGQYAYSVVEQLDLDAAGNAVPGSRDAMTMRNYVAADGSVVSIRTGSQNGCFTFSGGNAAGFSTTTAADLAAMPRDVGQLEAYLRAHVQGSSSRDEAVFAAVGDMVGGPADGLASPSLRAAMLAVLSRTPGVYLHLDARDYLGRPAIRADFVNQAIRPGEVRSYYFDPQDFRLLEERDGNNGAPAHYAGPSPAYTAPAPATAIDPAELSGPAFVTLVRSQTVVDSRPSC